MKQYKGMGRVFSFTLIQQVRQKGWRTTTLLLALACLIIPIVSLTAAAQHQKNAAPDQNVTAWESYDQDVLDSAGLTSRQQELLTVRVDVSVTGGRSGEGQAADVLSMVLPFVSLMLLYFLVLLYGQGTAASVLLEKTSKLMDLFLVSVEPTAMVLGKVLATALAGLLQLAVWILSLMGGFAAGGALARQTAPGVTLPLLEVLRGAGPAGGSVQCSGYAGGRWAAAGRLPAVLQSVRHRRLPGREGRGSVQHQRAVFPGAGGQLPVLHVRRGHGRHDLLCPVAGLCAVHRRAGNAQPGPAGADVPDGGPCVPGAGGRLRRTADGPGRPCVPADVPV